MNHKYKQSYEKFVIQNVLNNKLHLMFNNPYLWKCNKTTNRCII